MALQFITVFHPGAGSLRCYFLQLRKAPRVLLGWVVVYVTSVDSPMIYLLNYQLNWDNSL